MKINLSAGYTTIVSHFGALKGPSVSPINFKGSVDLTKSPADNNVNNPNPGDYFVVSKASESQEFLDTNWANLQHECCLSVPTLCGPVQSGWVSSHLVELVVVQLLTSLSLTLMPVVVVQVLEMYWGSAEAASINISNAVVTGNSAL